MTEEMSNMYKNGHKKKENGQKNSIMREIKEDRTTTKKNTKITIADNAEHQTGQDNIYVPQRPLNAEIVRRGDITKRCAVSPKNTLYG